MLVNPLSASRKQSFSGRDAFSFTLIRKWFENDRGNEGDEGDEVKLYLCTSGVLNFQAAPVHNLYNFN